MNESYSIKDLITLLWSHVRLIFLLTIIGLASGYYISTNYLPLEYSSHISLYVQSYTDIDDTTDQYNNISSSKQLVNTYIEVMKDDAVMYEVSRQLTKQFDEPTIAANFAVNNGIIKPDSLRSCLAISTVADTSAINVAATAKNPEVAAFICNSLIKIAPKYMERAVGVGSINTIGEAKINEAPVSPNVMRNTMMGGMVGFMFMIGIIFLNDFFNNTIRDSEVLINKYRKALLGEIQQFGDNELKKRMKPDKYKFFKLTDDNLPFYVVESYKSVRTNINFSLSTTDRKIFAVSSAKFGEGKSSTAANIAIAMAQRGKKVLLIDADMRKSVQHTIFGLKNKRGLSTAISQMDPLDKCIHKNVMENLDVMTAGPIPPNPSELLASEHMTDILNELNSKYSTIIIDTPPVNSVTDAMELTKKISGIVLVVRYGYTNSEDLKEAIKKIEFVQLNMYGFIMNGIKDSKQENYYYKYSYGRRLYYKKGNGYVFGYKGYKKKADAGQTAKNSQ